MKNSFGAVLGAAMMVVPAVAYAQTSQVSATQATNSADAGARTTTLIEHNASLAGSYEIDTTIPEAPGFAVIGLSPTEVIDPGASRITFASLANYLDEDNNLKSGLAIGGMPYWWLQKPGLATYRQRNAGPLGALARLSVSLGYVRGEAGEPDRVGLGFSTELLKSGDYRFNQNIYDCVWSAYASAFGRGDSHDVGSDPARFQEFQERAAAELDKPAAERETFGDSKLAQDPTSESARVRWKLRWADLAYSRDSRPAPDQISAYGDNVKACQADFFAKRVSWTLAGGVALRHHNGDTESDGGSIWTAYRHPLRLSRTLPTPNYVSLFGRYDFDKAADATGATSVQTYDKAVIALVVGYEAAEWKLSGQAGYERLNYHGVGAFADDSYGFYSVSYNYNLSNNVWLEFLAGRRNDRLSKANGTDSYVLLNVHWAPNLLAGGS